MSQTQIRSLATSAKRDIRTLIQSDSVKAQIALALPKHMTADRMCRVALTAIIKNPKLMDCTPESLLSSLMQCSQVGLEPDGRNAHLIPYGTVCQVIFDWKGFVALARRNGVFATPKLVCENDKFVVKEDDGTGHSAVLHEIDYTKARGEVYAVYCRARIGDEVDYEIMTRDEVEYVRNTFSRGKDADAWKKSWGEMAKKTVLRRHSKRWPLDFEVAQAFEDPEDTSTLPAGGIDFSLPESGTVQVDKGLPETTAPTGDVATPTGSVKAQPKADAKSPSASSELPLGTNNPHEAISRAGDESRPTEKKSQVRNTPVKDPVQLPADAPARELSTPQGQLSQQCDLDGISFDEFRDYLVRENFPIPNLDSLGSWMELPAKLCSRWVKDWEFTRQQIKGE